ncbi:MAG: MATE family efflux transporter [Eubacteriales bacterium]|nr:MATE family efflux transporter [Eubacteriales bacterium]
MVGTLGSYAISAVGLTNQPRLIILAVFMALNHGITAVISRRFGQRDREGANRALRQILLLAAIAVIGFAAVGEIISEPLLRFAGAKSDTLGYAVTYFRIILCGIPAVVMTMGINAAQRGVGNTRIAMRTNLTANFVNCAFNWLLINGHLGFPALGVAGAATATVIGNYVGLVIAVCSLLHRDRFLCVSFRESFRPDLETLRPVFKIASSACLEQVFLRVGFFIYAKIVAELGTDDYATHQIGMNILSLSFCFGDGLTAAASSLVGRSLGEKRPDLAVMYGKCGQRIGFCIAVILAIFFVTCARPIYTAFTRDEAIIAKGIPIIYMCAVVTAGQISQVVFSGCLRGAGDTLYIAVTSMISIALIRPVVSWYLCYPAGLGLYGAWYGVIIDQYLRLLLNGIRFSKGKWTKIVV